MQDARVQCALDDVASNICWTLGGGRGARGDARHQMARRLRGHRGRAVQVDPIKPTLKASGTRRLKLICDDPLSKIGFKFNLRRYTVEALHVLRKREAKDKKLAEDAQRPPLATRVWMRTPKTLGAGVGLVTWSVVKFYKFVTWAVKLYMAAHMFFRAFLADPFSSFSSRGGVENNALHHRRISSSSSSATGLHEHSP